MSRDPRIDPQPGDILREPSTGKLRRIDFIRDGSIFWRALELGDVNEEKEPLGFGRTQIDQFRESARLAKAEVVRVGP